MKEITIVTALFDINRKNINGFNRSNQQYIDNFKFWAKIRNNIVVYGDSETINQVKKIREEYGLLNKTKTVIIDDYTTIDEELYNIIDKVMSKKEFLEFHMQRNIPEAINSKYNYIMALKSWCCYNAVEEKLTTEMVCWLDFGFNYGGLFYKNSDDFNFEWKYDFSDKIHLFQINDFDDLPEFEIIRRNNSYIQGGEIVAPTYLWKELWIMVRNNIIALAKAGLTDDDQIFYLMSYKERPELFELHKCEWLGLFKNFSDRKFQFEKPKKNIILDILHKCKHPTEFKFLNKIYYSIRTYKLLKNTSQKG